MSRRLCLFTMMIMLLGIAMACGSVQAATVDFWFARQGDASGTAIDSINAPLGSDFTFSVWYKTDQAWQHSGLELLIGYDRSTTWGDQATPTDGKIASEGLAADNFNAVFPEVLWNTVAGGDWTADGEFRPYGVSVIAGPSLGSTISSEMGRRICDITLRNADVTPGGYYDMGVWSFDNGGIGYVSMLSSDAGLLYAKKNTTLRVYSPTVPEPGSMLGLVSGVMGLACILRRRRTS